MWCQLPTWQRSSQHASDHVCDNGDVLCRHFTNLWSFSRPCQSGLHNRRYSKSFQMSEPNMCHLSCHQQWRQPRITQLAFASLPCAMVSGMDLLLPVQNCEDAFFTERVQLVVVTHHRKSSSHQHRVRLPCLDRCGSATLRIWWDAILSNCEKVVEFSSGVTSAHHAQGNAESVTLLSSRTCVKTTALCYPITSARSRHLKFRPNFTSMTMRKTSMENHS